MTSYRQMMWPVQAYHWSFLFESQKNGLAGHFRLAEQYFGHPWFNPLKICGLTNEKITCIDLLRRGRLTPQGLGYLSVCLFFFCCLTMTGAPLRIGWAIVEPSTKKKHFKNKGGGGGRNTQTHTTPKWRTTLTCSKSRGSSLATTAEDVALAPVVAPRPVGGGRPLEIGAGRRRPTETLHAASLVREIVVPGVHFKSVTKRWDLD